MGKLPSQTHKVGDAERLGARGGCDTASLKGGIEHVLGKAVGAHGIADGLATLSKCSVNHAGHKFAIESFGHHTVNTVDTHDGRVHVCAGIKQRGGTSKRPVTCAYRPSFAV